MRRWIWRTLPRGLSISGGRADVGNGESPLASALSFNFAVFHNFWFRFSVQGGAKHVRNRDVAAGICILREAGGLITSANPPANIETDPIEEVRLGSRLYLAIRYAPLSLCPGRLHTTPKLMTLAGLRETARRRRGERRRNVSYGRCGKGYIT